MAEAVRITWNDGFITVEPDFPDVLLSKLSYWRRVQVQEGWKRKMMNQKEEVFVVTPYEEPSLLFPAQMVRRRRLVTMDGFLHRVKTVLNEAGWAYSVEDKRTLRPAPDIELALSKLWEKQKPAVYTALMSGGGILSCPTGFGKTHLAAAIIRAYSKEALKLRGTPLVVFAAPERDINAKNYEELVALLPDREVGIMQSGRKQVITDDVMLVTLDSLQNLDPSQIGLFICDEVHTGVSDSRSTCIQEMKRAIKFGVSATPSGRYDGKDLVMEALFGPVVYKKTYQEAVADGILVPIEVVWVESPEPEFGLTYYQSLKTREGKYKRAVIANKDRNRLIGDIMAAIPEQMQTVAIMPIIEHMSKLLPFCPESTRVVHAETNAESLYKRGFDNIPAISTADRRTIYGEMVAGNIHKILATHVYKQGVNFPGLEVMINVGGGGGEIAAKQIPGRVSRTASGKEKAWLIDFWHPWDKRKDAAGKEVPGPVHGDDKKRKRFYTELGFTQTWIKSADELPFLPKPEAPAPEEQT